MNTVILIVGPTGCGKTELSVKLAKKIGAEIISCDSMQVYKGLNIGTAKATKEEQNGIPHYMLDIKSPFESYSVSDFCIDAKKCANEIFSKGKPVIMVGGTGLYADSFIKDISYTEGASKDEAIRKELSLYAENNGETALHNLLSEIDPESANTIHKNNVKRVIRAIEYYRITGETISEHNKRTKEKPSPYKYVYVLLTRDREELYERIDKRVEQMMQKGLLCEVWTLYKMGLKKEHTSMQALGYKELVWYLEGKCTLWEAVNILKRNSRRYAKRQLTWFGRNDEANIINLSHFQDADEATEKIMDILYENEVIF